MKGKDLRYFFICILSSFFFGYFIFNNEYCEYSDLITFLSIMIGFKISSLSILFNSPLKKVLYDRKIMYYKTELHRLKCLYQHSIYFEVIAVTSLFVTYSSSFRHLLVMPIICGTLFCFFFIVSDLLKIFVYPTNES